MAKARKDKKGRVLRKGESYHNTRQSYCFSYMDPLGKRRFIYARDLGELRAKEDDILKDKLDGVEVYLMNNATLNDVFDRYISTKTELRSSTRFNYLYTYDRYVREGLGRKKIVNIKYSDVLLYYKAILDKGLSLSVVDNIHSVIHPAFQMAVRDNVLRINPSDGVMAEIKKKSKNRPEPRHALTIVEQRAFLEFLDRPENERWKPLFVTMFGTGCRVGEVIGLTWDDVDFDANTISINHNLTYHPMTENGNKCEFDLTLPKTAAGIRTIPILDNVREVLLEELEYQRDTGMRCVSEVQGMRGFIFFNRFGTIHNPQAINRAIKRLVDDHNCEEEIKAAREGREPILIPRFSCHITRHTFCTRLCESNNNVKLIQTIMGHKDIQTTLDIYAEISEAKQQEIFQGLNAGGIW